MAFAARTHFNVSTSGHATNFGGGFDPTNAGFLTDLAATGATGTAPVVTSASYNFDDTDVDHWIFIQAGTNWRVGWYKITSVDAGAATLNATAEAYSLYPIGVSAYDGCATVASPTGGTWAMDYSRSAPPLQFTDLVIDATTNTDISSAAHTLGKQMLGNIIPITSGTGFTVQRIQLTSYVSAGVLRADKAVGTVGSTGGTGYLGGALASPGGAAALAVAESATQCHISVWAGTYSLTSTSAAASGKVTFPTNTSNTALCGIRGCNTVPGDQDGTRPTMRGGVAGANNYMINMGSSLSFVENLVLDGNNGTYASWRGISAATGQSGHIFNVKFLNMDGNAIAPGAGYVHISNCEFTAIGSGAVIDIASRVVGMDNCYFHANSGHSIQMSNGFGKLTAWNLLFANNTGRDIYNSNADGAGLTLANCTFYGNSSHAIQLNATSSGNYQNPLQLSNCLFSEVTGTAVYLNAAQANVVLRTCAFYSCGSNYDSTKLWRSYDEIALTADPFTNKGSNNFTLNSVSGGGAEVVAAGYPQAMPGLSSVANYPRVGAYSPDGTVATAVTATGHMGLIGSRSI